MTDLVEWLTAQLDADESVAGAAEDTIDGGGGWWSESDMDGLGGAVEQVDAAFIAANSPTAVLRTIAAHRAILARHARGGTFGQYAYHLPAQAEIGTLTTDLATVEPVPVFDCRHCRVAWPCPDVLSLAAIYQDQRPGFDPSWKVET